MDTQELWSELAVLLEHMASVGYSKKYIDDVRRVALRLDDADGDARAAKGPEPSLPASPLEVVRQFRDGGVLPRTPEARRHVLPSSRDALCRGFAEICDAYETSDRAASKRPATVRGEISCASSFLLRLQEAGARSPEDVTEDDVIRVLTDEGGRPAYSCGYARRIRAVLGEARGVKGCKRLKGMVPVPRAWRKAPEPLSESEASEVRDALGDPASGLSARDRAIGCVLFYTGMRASDVAALRLGSIDWELDRIEFRQKKTGAAVCIPLTAPVGNAILDYVSRERCGDSPHLFLSLAWPFGRLSAKSLYHVANRVLDAAGVRTEPGDRRGTHLFRRTVASSMLRAGVDRQVIAATLGHESAITTERYMAADVEALRSCALDVSRFPIGRGALGDE